MASRGVRATRMTSRVESVLVRLPLKAVCLVSISALDYVCDPEVRFEHGGYDRGCLSIIPS